VNAAKKIEFINPFLDKELINAFIESVVKTMSLMANTEVKVEKPTIEQVFVSKGEVAGVVGMVAGEMKGTLTITYQKAAIIKIVENMLAEVHEEVDDGIADCVGELANQVYGDAKAALNKKGHAYEMAIPSVIRGSFIISKQHRGATLVIPFQVPSNGSQFFVEITVSK